MQKYVLHILTVASKYLPLFYKHRTAHTHKTHKCATYSQTTTIVFLCSFVALGFWVTSSLHYINNMCKLYVFCTRTKLTLKITIPKLSHSRLHQQKIQSNYSTLLHHNKHYGLLRRRVVTWKF